MTMPGSWMTGQVKGRNRFLCKYISYLDTVFFRSYPDTLFKNRRSEHQELKSQLNHFFFTIFIDSSYNKV